MKAPFATSAGENPGTSPYKTHKNPSKTFIVVATLMSFVWLGFLFFPVASALALPIVPRVASLVLTAVFGLLYVLTLSLSWFLPPPGHGSYRYFDGIHGLRRGDALAMLATVAIVPLQMVILGPLDSLSFFPFLAAAAPFALPQVAGYVVGALTVLTAFLIPTFVPGDQDYFGIALITTAVFLAVAGIAFFIGAGIEGQKQAATQAIFEERERVARDVHDVLGHTLTVIALKSELAGKLLERDPERARAELTEVTKLARESIEEVRQTVGGLRVQSLSEELTAAAQALASAGVELELHGLASGDLAKIPASNQAIFAWVIREATTNIIRHANATRAEISLSARTVTITDNGAGIDPHASGHGLEGLRARVVQAGGNLSITGKTSDGTMAGETGKTRETGTKVEVRM